METILYVIECFLVLLAKRTSCETQNYPCVVTRNHPSTCLCNQQLHADVRLVQSCLYTDACPSQRCTLMYAQSIKLLSIISIDAFSKEIVVYFAVHRCRVKTVTCQQKECNVQNALSSNAVKYSWSLLAIYRREPQFTKVDERSYTKTNNNTNGVIDEKSRSENWIKFRVIHPIARFRKCNRKLMLVSMVKTSGLVSNSRK